MRNIRIYISLFVIIVIFSNILLARDSPVTMKGSIFNRYNLENKREGLWYEPGIPNGIRHSSPNFLLGYYKNGLQNGLWVEYSGKTYEIVKTVLYNNISEDTTKITVSKYKEGKVISEKEYLSIVDTTEIDSVYLYDVEMDKFVYKKVYSAKIIVKYNYEFLRDYDSLNPIILIRKEDE